MYHQFNIQQFYVLPTQCIYGFCVDLRTNSDYFTVQHWLVGFYNRDAACSLSGTDWICKYNSVQAVICQPVTAEARAQSQANPCAIYGGHSGTVTGFCPGISIFPCHYIPPLFHTHIHLNVALTRRKGRRLDTFQKAEIFCKSRNTGYKSVFTFTHSLLRYLHTSHFRVN